MVPVKLKNIAVWLHLARITPQIKMPHPGRNPGTSFRHYVLDKPKNTNLDLFLTTAINLSGSNC